jgi:hypothetical protein
VNQIGAPLREVGCQLREGQNVGRSRGRVGGVNNPGRNSMRMEGLEERLDVEPAVGVDRAIEEEEEVQVEKWAK